MSTPSLYTRSCRVQYENHQWKQMLPYPLPQSQKWEIILNPKIWRPQPESCSTWRPEISRVISSHVINFQGLSLTTKNIVLVEDDIMYSVQFNYVEVTPGYRSTLPRKQTDSCPFLVRFDIFSISSICGFSPSRSLTGDVKCNCSSSMDWKHLHPRCLWNERMRSPESEQKGPRGRKGFKIPTASVLCLSGKRS